MSVEAPFGGMSVGIATASAPAMGVGSFSAEMTSAPAFAGSNLGMEKSGGSFAPGVSATSLFAETSPFSAFLGSVREGTIKGITGNSLEEDGWTTLAIGDVANTPSNTDIFAQTTPFAPVGSDISEKVSAEDARSIVSNKSAWEIVAKTPKASDMQPEQWISVTSKDVVEETPAEVDSITDLFSVTENLVPSTSQEEPIVDININALREIAEKQVVGEAISIPAKDLVQADKVAELFVDVGVYSKDEARKRVGEIVREANGISLSEEIDVAGKIEAVEDRQATDVPETLEAEKVDVNGTINTVQEHEDLNGATSHEKEKQPSQDNFVLTTYAVDDRAQEERRQSFNARAWEIFNGARQNGQETINAQEIAQVNEEEKHRSELLAQAGLRVPDGSFDQDIKDIRALGEFKNTPQAEKQIIGGVKQVLDNNVAVKAVRGVASKSATKEDAEKVFKFTKNTIISTIPSK